MKRVKLRKATRKAKARKVPRYDMQRLGNSRTLNLTCLFLQEKGKKGKKEKDLTANRTMEELITELVEAGILLRVS